MAYKLCKSHNTRCDKFGITEVACRERAPRLTLFHPPTQATYTVTSEAALVALLCWLAR